MTWLTTAGIRSSSSGPLAMLQPTFWLLPGLHLASSPATAITSKKINAFHISPLTDESSESVD
jgi:hypothetical protein